MPVPHTGAAACAVAAFVLLAIPVAASPQSAQDPAAAVPRIPVADFKKLVDQRAVLIVDVRDPQSYEAGHIPDALNIPLDRLEKEATTLRASKKPIVTYCS